MKKTILILWIVLAANASFAAENIRSISTWNMKWLGVSMGTLDDTQDIPRYLNHIKTSKATLFAIQEITPSHAVPGVVKCHFLELIVKELNTDNGKWTFCIDKKNGSQRLGFLYDADRWKFFDAKTIYPGSAFKGRLRDPLIGLFQAIGDNALLKLNIINIHMKAFPDGDAKRKAQFSQLAAWLKQNTVDDDVIICGDTNIYIDETGTASALLNAGYTELKDTEGTAIHEGTLSQRFDRFYISEGLKEEVDSAKQIVGEAALVDSLQEAAHGNYNDFDKHVSDHFAVILAIDVSEER